MSHLRAPGSGGQGARPLRIGCGAGYAGDRIEPAVELVERGDLDVIVFECLAERTIALAQQAKAADPDGGFDPLLEDRMNAVLPVVAEVAGTYGIPPAQVGQAALLSLIHISEPTRPY